MRVNNTHTRASVSSRGVALSILEAKRLRRRLCSSHLVVCTTPVRHFFIAVADRAGRSAARLGLQRGGERCGGIAGLRRRGVAALRVLAQVLRQLILEMVRLQRGEKERSGQQQCMVQRKPEPYEQRASTARP